MEALEGLDFILSTIDAYAAALLAPPPPKKPPKKKTNSKHKMFVKESANKKEPLKRGREDGDDSFAFVPAVDLALSKPSKALPRLVRAEDDHLGKGDEEGEGGSAGEGGAAVPSAELADLAALAVARGLDEPTLVRLASLITKLHANGAVLSLSGI